MLAKLAAILFCGLFWGWVFYLSDFGAGLSITLGVIGFLFAAFLMIVFAGGRDD